MSNKSEDLEKIRRANVRNILARVRDGKPLTEAQMKLVRQELKDEPAMPAKKKDQDLSATEFAKAVNLDPRRVQQLAKQGIIEKSGRGKYPPSQVLAYIRYLQGLVQQRKIKPDLPEGALDPEQQKARADKERADKLALENEARRGELVEVSEIEIAWADIALAIRSKLLGMGAKLAPTLAPVNKPAKIKEAIDEAMRQVLEELSRNADDELADE